MPEQAALTFDPLKEGLFRLVLDRNQIDHHKWLRAHAEHAFVGTCRACGGHLAPLAPYEHNKTWWYEAECINCRKPILAPGGRVLARSSRHSEMPPGWWENRNRHLKNSGEASL